jgi:hypothetical protein
MKRIISVSIMAVFLLSCISAFPQRFGLSGGLNLSHYVDFSEDNPHEQSEYEIGLGYSFNIFVDNLFDRASKIPPFKFSAGFSNYKGEAEYYSGGLGGGKRETASINKNLVNLSVYPLNFSPGSFYLSGGMYFEWLVNDQSTGTGNGWSMSNPVSVSYELEQVDNTDFQFGFAVSAQYEFALSPMLGIFPCYMASFSLANDINDAKAWRHYFSVGLVKQLKKNSNL